MCERDLPSQQINNVAAQGASCTRQFEVRRVRRFKISVDGTMTHCKQIRLSRALTNRTQPQRFEELCFEILVIWHPGHCLDDRSQKEITDIAVAPYVSGFGIQIFNSAEIIFDSLRRCKRLRESFLGCVDGDIRKP